MAGHGAKQRYTPEEVAAAIVATHGIVRNAARRLRCDDCTVREYVKRYPEVAEALRDARETGLDIAESKLFQLIEKGNLQAIIFYLRTQGRSRGYGDHVEVASPYPVTVNIVEIPSRESLAAS